MTFSRLNILCRASIALVVLFLSSCISIDYVGQSLPPLPSDKSVAFYNSTTEVPANSYDVIGRAEVDAPDGTNSEEIKHKLINEARKHGADAIQVVSFERIKTGVYSRPVEREADGTVGGWMATATHADGSPIYNDSFSRNVPLQTTDVDTFAIKVKVLFLAKREKYQREIEQNREERERYMHQSSRYAK